MFVVTGPESCGKTTLSRALARELRLPAVAEAARQYLVSSRYQPSDLLRIAAVQQRLEQAAGQSEFIADTDLQVLYIWWQEKYGPVPGALASAYASQSARFYLLCRPDLPWVADPLRENPTDRERLFALYERDLKLRGVPYHVIEGQQQARTRSALEAVERWRVQRSRTA